MFVLLNRISAIFMKIEITVYTSFQNSTLLFIKGLIFDVLNIQNNQFLNLNEFPCYYHLDMSMIEGFYGSLMFSLSLFNSVQQCQGNFTKDVGQKIFILWQTYERLEISVNYIIEATQYLL